MSHGSGATARWVAASLAMGLVVWAENGRAAQESEGALVFNRPPAFNLPVESWLNSACGCEGHAPHGGAGIAVVKAECSAVSRKAT